MAGCRCVLWGGGPTPARAVTLAALLLATGASPVALGGAREDARAAYEHGLAAAKQGDLLEAANAFARADELVPSAVALTSALQAAIDADAPLLALELAERTEGRPPEAGDKCDFRKAAARARERFAGRAGRLLVRCPPSAACTASVDGRPLALGRPKWLEPGAHQLVSSVDGASAEQRVAIAPDGSSELVLESRRPVAPLASQPGPPGEPAPTPHGTGPSLPPQPTGAAAPPTPAPVGTEPEAPAAFGLSPAWFFVAAGVTVALGAGTVASALDTRSRHDDFVATGVGGDAGRASQTRTDALFFTSLGLALGTTLLGALGIDWSSLGGSPSSARLELAPAGLRLRAPL
jgi:hypothetical protein